jgi:hypothetical protein
MSIEETVAKIQSFLTVVSPYSNVTYVGYEHEEEMEENAVCFNYKAVNIRDIPVEVSVCLPDESSPDYGIWERAVKSEPWYFVYDISLKELEEEV